MHKLYLNKESTYLIINNFHFRCFYSKCLKRGERTNVSIAYMFQRYKKSNDTLEAFSYYRSYFDRVTAHLMYSKGIERAGKGKPMNFEQV